MFDKAELVRIVWAHHVEFVQFEIMHKYNIPIAKTVGLKPKLFKIFKKNNGIFHRIDVIAF